jgi:hypothetical protein
VRNLLERGHHPKLQPDKTISVPAQIYEWKADTAKRDRAKELQLTNRQQFLNGFSSGLAVLGYTRDPEGNGTYLLARPGEKFEFSWGSEQEATSSCT